MRTPVPVTQAGGSSAGPGRARAARPYSVRVIDPAHEAPLSIAETFLSLQGEGKLAGTPSHFIRVSGCNLRCAWCDTPYSSWSPEGSARGIAELADAAATSGAGHAVVTGGEPMVFPGVIELCARLRGRGMHVTVETAGTVFRAVGCDLLSLSPKLSNSTPAAGDQRDPGGAWRTRHEARRLDRGALAGLLGLECEKQLKFVVCSPGDLDEIDALLAGLSGWSPADVFLMPEGVTAPSPETREWVTRACLERGFRYGHRLHIELFGHRRGT